MTEAQRRKLQQDDSIMRDKKNDYLDDLIRERDAHLATLPQDAPVIFERETLKKRRKQQPPQQEEPENDDILEGMRRDIKRMMIEVKWACLNSLQLAVNNGDLTNMELVELYRIVK